MKKLLFFLLIILSILSVTACGSDDASVTVTKTASCASDRTVHPGDKITYLFTVENPTASRKKITITDTIPQHTAFAGGDTICQNGMVEFEVTARAKTTECVSYTVEVSSDEDLIGLPIVSDAAKADDIPLSCETLYIGRTLSEGDREKFSLAVSAMLDSEMKGKELFRFIYTVAFSKVPPINEEASGVVNHLFLDRRAEETKTYTSMVAPGLYGGKKLSASTEALFLGDREESIELGDMMVGDFLFVLPSADDLSAARVYCTDGVYLYDLTESCERLEKSLSSASLSECDYYAVLRPSLAMSLYRTESFYEGETDIEKSIIATAKAYLLRGDRMQYADTRLVTSIQNYRWERGKAPEDYTTDETGYSNCTGFVHDVYLHALGWDYGDFQLKNSPEEMKAFTYFFTGNEKGAAQAELKESYLSSLQVGDIVFYSYSSNNHAMLYIGNGNLIHCSGSTHNGYVEKEEPAIRLDSVETLFDPASSRYLFSKEKPRSALYIIRPLDMWQGSEIPEQAQKRILDMQGIFAEKTCSATLGQTVNPGDTLTYTFTVFNSNSDFMTVNITDLIPENTLLLTEGGAAMARASLSWSLSLAPLEKRSVSYKVIVSEAATEGDVILCTDESKVGGILTKATPVFVGRTLTTEEQETIRETTLKMVGSELDAISLLNAIYKEALGIDAVIDVSLADLPNEIFPESGNLKKLAESGYYSEMIAPSQYGGRTVLDSERFLGERTRLTRERNLIVGDVLYLKGTSTYGLYIYLGDGVLLDLSGGLKTVDIEERLEVTLGWPMFAILRPSLAFSK